MIDWEEEEKYKQSTSISVEFGNRSQVVDSLTRRSTVFEVLHRLLQQLELQEGKWVFIEVWRGVERPLPPRTRILRVWHAWCNEQRHVIYKIQKATPNQSRFHQHPKKRRRPIIKGPERYIEETWTDTDSISSDSSDSVLDDSINTSDSDSESDELNDFPLKEVLISRVTEQSTHLEKLSRVESELDERIRFIENNIHVNSLCNSIQDYKEQTQLLEARLCSTNLTIVGLQQSIRDETINCAPDEVTLMSHIQQERARLEAGIKRQIMINDRLELEALELSRERSVLAGSVTARQELLSNCGLTSTVSSDHNSDSEFYVNNQLEVSLDNSCYLDGTVDRFMDVSIYNDEADDDADDEDAEDYSDTGRLSSRDSYDLSDVMVTNVPCSPRDSQVSQCYNCPDCKRPKNRQSGSSDSGNVSDDSKITSLSSDALSFTDSAISSVSSAENYACNAGTCGNAKLPVSPPKANLWKTESTDNESDIFTSREVYAKQLRKNSKIIRSASTKKHANGASISKPTLIKSKDHMPLYKPIELAQTDHLNVRIIETLV